MRTASCRLLGVCAVLMAIAVANAASGELASVVVVGLAKCSDCTRKNMKAEAAFKGRKVAIKCQNSNGEFENKAIGELQSSGAFSVPLSVDLYGANCHAQLHNAAGTPCPGQEPSRITPLADGSFVAIPRNVQQPSAECASVTICGPIRKDFLDHYHKKPNQPKPEPEPKPKPEPEPKPSPEYQHPTPSYGSPTPIYIPLATDQKDHKLDHFLNHFHNKSVPPKPEIKPEPKPQPEYHPPTLTYGSPTPTHESSTPTNKHPFFNHFHKDHDYHHIFEHFHKKTVPPEPKPEPKPQPENRPPTPSNGSPTPIYHPPAKY